MTTYTDVTDDTDEDEVLADQPQADGLLFNVATNSQYLILGAI